MFSYLPLCGSRTDTAGLIGCEQQIWMEAQLEPGAGRKPEKRKIFNKGNVCTYPQYSQLLISDLKQKCIHMKITQA